MHCSFLEIALPTHPLTEWLDGIECGATRVAKSGSPRRPPWENVRPTQVAEWGKPLSTASTVRLGFPWHLDLDGKHSVLLIIIPPPDVLYGSYLEPYSHFEWTLWLQLLQSNPDTCIRNWHHLPQHLHWCLSFYSFLSKPTWKPSCSTTTRSDLSTWVKI